MGFISSETTALVEITTVGEFKRYFVDRLKSILSLTVQNTSKLEKGVELYKRTYAKLVAERQQQSQGQAKAYQLDAELEQSDHELAKLLSPEPKSPKTTRLPHRLTQR
jgi:hypothetical protein